MYNASVQTDEYTLSALLPFTTTAPALPTYLQRPVSLVPGGGECSRREGAPQLPLHNAASSSDSAHGDGAAEGAVSAAAAAAAAAAAVAADGGGCDTATLSAAEWQELYTPQHPSSNLHHLHHHHDPLLSLSCTSTIIMTLFSSSAASTPTLSPASTPAFAS
jgi:hypothetical protein